MLAGAYDNNVLTGMGGNDTLNGGAGIDTAVYANPRSAHTIATTVNGHTVAGPEGTDTLSSVERLQFSDKKVAIDLAANQAGSNTVRVIGAAFDAPAIQQHSDWVGIGLQLFDGGMTMPQVCGLVAQLMGQSNTSAPPAHQTSASSSEGSAQFVVQESTRFALNASRVFSKKTALADVVMVGRESKEFGDLAQCESPAEVVVLSLVLQDPQVSSALRVMTVTNRNARPIVLRKENVRVALTAGQTSSAFATQPAVGLWEVTAALNPQETCDEALAELRDRLSIRLAFSCRE